MKTHSCANLAFMALVIWREARGEAVDGKSGVAHCIMNRVNRPCWWGEDILSVVCKKWQFSSMTDPKDKQLTTWPKSDDREWNQCLSIAAGVIEGTLFNPVPGADSYHDVSISPPAWAADAVFIKKIGRLLFYDVDKDIEANKK